MKNLLKLIVLLFGCNFGYSQIYYSHYLDATSEWRVIEHHGEAGYHDITFRTVFFEGLENLNGYYLSVLDGHGGSIIVDYAYKHLPIYFDERMKSLENSDFHEDYKIIEVMHILITYNFLLIKRIRCHNHLFIRKCKNSHFNLAHNFNILKII